MNEAEVKGMFLTEYDEKKILEQERQEGIEEGRREGRREGHREGRQEGRREGRSEGIDETNERVAADMLRENFPLQLIVKISKLSEDVIRGIAGNLGLAVM